MRCNISSTIESPVISLTRVREILLNHFCGADLVARDSYREFRSFRRVVNFHPPDLNARYVDGQKGDDDDAEYCDGGGDRIGVGNQ